MNDLALVVLNYNNFDDTIKCVDQLNSFDDSFRIIVVDNYSTNESVQVLRKSFAEYANVDIILSEKNGGYSYGNNLGIKYAINKYKSKYIGILNPDVIIPSVVVFDELLETLEKNPNIAMVGGSVIENELFSPYKSGWNIPTSKEVVLDRLLVLSNRRDPTYLMMNEKYAKVDCIVGCFFIIKTDIFEKIGLFDESVFLYNEENILGIKLKKLGYESVIVANQFYYHNHDFSNDKNKSLSSKIAALKVRFKSRKYLITTYYSKMLVPFLFLVELINCTQITLGHFKNKITRLIRTFGGNSGNFY
ncbi:glycosyltransferase family 2 protein [Streptococcus sp. NLN64]|uniref:glycosyltransferase n=1 Tax=Streptococcus sp. NLN64 TaxID=2822799 RepID=UPI0018C95FAB|nr:glycosyltransferase family 2 protein [Streptococcus sp. NLN64]MBG9367201.1 glycosyltransferase family 2 protein [Streptococcus sp. NLN64]